MKWEKFKANIPSEIIAKEKEKIDKRKNRKTTWMDYEHKKIMRKFTEYRVK